MAKILTILFSIFLFFAAPLPATAPNSCFISALELKYNFEVYARLHKINNWARILILEWSDNLVTPNGSNGHAVCVFEYNGVLYAYDPELGTQRADIEFKDCPLLIAWELYGVKNVKFAKFVE